MEGHHIIIPGEHTWLVNLSPPNVPPLRNDGLIMGLITDLIKGNQWVSHKPSHQLSNPRLDLLRQLAPEMLPVAAGGCAFGPESRRRQTLVKPPIFRIIGTICGRICNLEKWGPFKLLDIYSGTPLIGRKPTYRVRFVEVLQVYAVQKLHVPPRKRTAKNTEKSVWKTILSFSNDSF